MLNDVAIDEIIVGIVSLLGVAAGTVFQRKRQGETPDAPERQQDWPDSEDDLRDALRGLSQENRRLRARLKALESGVG